MPRILKKTKKKLDCNCAIALDKGDLSIFRKCTCVDNMDEVSTPFEIIIDVRR